MLYNVGHWKMLKVETERKTGIGHHTFSTKLGNGSQSANRKDVEDTAKAIGVPMVCQTSCPAYYFCVHVVHPYLVQL